MTRPVTDHRSRRLFLAVLAVILLAGLALRFYRFAPPGSRADPAAPLAALPPGLDSDEAFHTLAALRLTRGEVAPFFRIDQGLPAAMIYLTALVFQFTGPVAEAGRIASAIMGIAALVVIPLLTRRLFPDQPAAVVVAAANTAFTFWFVNFSRIGLEQMTAAALITLAAAAFRGWQERGGPARAVCAGLALALALYSYPAAYFLPAALALYAIYAAALAAPRWKPKPRETIIALVSFALAAAPLILFFVQNPDWAMRRASQTGGDWMRLIPNYARALGGVVWRGDEIVRHNIPGRPLLDPVQSAFVVVGLIDCLRRWRKTPYGLLLIWLVVMLLPPTLSDSPAHFGRMAGSVGAVALVAGVGGAALWRRLPRWLAVAVVGGGVAFSAARTAYDYFVLWPRSPAYLDTFDFPERIQAEAIASLPPDAAAYLSPSDRSRPIFAFLWGDAPRAQSFNGRVCAVFPERAARDTVWLVNSLEDTRAADVLSAVYTPLDTQALFVETGTPVITQYRVSRGVEAPVIPGNIGRVGDLVEAAAVRVGAPSPGSALPVNFQWRVAGATAENWTVGLYLLDGGGNVKAQDDRQPCDNSYPTSAWQAGEIIDEDRALALPPDLPPGDYTLAIAFYRLSDGERLPAVAPGGAQDTLLEISSIAVP